MSPVPGTETHAGADAPDSPPGGPRLSYIPALDGIRGVAMVVIMGYHGGVFFGRGGFYSLDTFFALSGFLITSLLVAEWQRTSSVRLRLFWARRARRLLPGLVVMLLGVSLSAAFLVPAGTYPDLRADGLASLFYVANWHFVIAGSNYFGQTGMASPLLHTVVAGGGGAVLSSVAARRARGPEEVGEPAGAAGGVRRRGSRLGSRDGAALRAVGRDRLYYGTDTRAQSLLVGAALAVALALMAQRRRQLATASPAATSRVPAGRAATRRGPPRRRRRAAAPWSVSASSAWPGAWRCGSSCRRTTPSPTGAVSCSPRCPRRSFCRASFVRSARCWPVACRSAPVRYVGRISYGMYLWHWPLFLYSTAPGRGSRACRLFAVRRRRHRGRGDRLVLRGRAAHPRRGIPAGPAAAGSWPPWRWSGRRCRLLASTVVPAVALPPAVPAPGAPPRSSVAVTGARPPVDGAHRGGLDGAHRGHRSGRQRRRLRRALPRRRHPRLRRDERRRVRAERGGCPHGAAVHGQRLEPEQWPAVWSAEIEPVAPRRGDDSGRAVGGGQPHLPGPLDRHPRSRLRRLCEAAAGAGGGRWPARAGREVVLMTAPCYDSGEQPDGQAWPEDSRPASRSTTRWSARWPPRSPGTTLLDFNAMACPVATTRSTSAPRRSAWPTASTSPSTAVPPSRSRIWPDRRGPGRGVGTAPPALIVTARRPSSGRRRRRQRGSGRSRFQCRATEVDPLSRLAAGHEGEAADDVLAPVVVAVEEIDSYGARSSTASRAMVKWGSSGSRKTPCQNPLSPAGTKMSRVSRRNSSGSTVTLVADGTLDVEVPTVEDGQSAADVLERHGQIDGLIVASATARPAGDLHPVVVLEADLLGWIFRSATGRGRDGCRRVAPVPWSVPPGWRTGRRRRWRRPGRGCRRRPE